jgi:hypothetical protein
VGDYVKINSSGTTVAEGTVKSIGLIFSSTDTGSSTIAVPFVIEKFVISPMLPLGKIVSSPEIVLIRVDLKHRSS